MKPGPAMSTEATFPSLRSLAAMLSASSRGFLPASLARTIAALVAMSPCVGSRGGSTTIREMSAPEPSTAAVAACTEASIVANRCCGLASFGMWLRLTQFRKQVKINTTGAKRLPDGRSAIDRNDLTGRDRRLIGGKINRHVGHMDRQPQAKQMGGSQLLDVFRPFEQFLYTLGKHHAGCNRIHPDLVGSIFSS